VPSELGEEEILVVVVPRTGGRLTVEDVLEWCRGRLAPMKVPRFITFTESMPHTPSHRVAKHLLKLDKTLRERAIDTALQQPKG
jgi:carnitine-CoA ligase